ncbi:hypothetical protein [Tautonia plasticadhaerens]|uniref:PEGA domain protein n=1 Tax=Tautonia plasticadhaerens TaxID=2527974 RepID=A0A518GWI8_9BACT|nr:hypothetical protein [Tautonia plasticadhaerens]QDV32943.1 hypothetical protein ElP_07850 [Tautonia plasticadhaerens]
MFVRPLLLVFAKSPILGQAAQSVAAGVLGMTMLSSIVAHSKGTSGEVVLHVVEPDVEVIFGGESFRVEGRRYEPIVRELSPGGHRLRVERDGRVLQDEHFRVERGGFLVLTAWDANGKDREAAGSGSPNVR